MILRKVGQLVEHEPYLWHGFSRPAQDSDQWELKIPVSIRDYRDVTSVEEYIDVVEQRVAPPEPPSQPLSTAPLDIPYAVVVLPLRGSALSAVLAAAARAGKQPARSPTHAAIAAVAACVPRRALIMTK